MFPARRESPVMNIQTLGQEIHTIAYLIAWAKFSRISMLQLQL